MSRKHSDYSDSGFSSDSAISYNASNISTSHGPALVTLTENLTVLDIRHQELSLATTENLAQTVIDTLSSKSVVLPASSIRFDREQNKHSSVFHISCQDTLNDEVADNLIRSIPTVVLYDDRGLELFNQITCVDEYYVTSAEMQIFANYAEELVRNYVKDGGVLIELGVGSMRKSKFLLDAIVAQQKKVTYYAIDLSSQSLSKSLAPLSKHYPTIQLIGLHGTYDDALEYVRSHVDRTEHASCTFLWLGTSIGNITRHEAAKFLSKVASTVMESGDTFICGIDRRNPTPVIKSAYDDTKGITRAFIMNGLRHVERILHESENNLFNQSNFEYVSLYNETLGQHEAYYRSLVDQTIHLSDGIKTVDIHLTRGELIFIEYSVKYDSLDIKRLVDGSGLTWTQEWVDSSGRYAVHCFQK